MNSDSSIAFSIFSGDIKNGATPCNDLYYGRFQDLANSLNYPTAYTIGDNEWTDCHRINNGNYLPTERLALIRQRFFNATSTGGTTILGKGSPLQTLGFGVAPYIENQYFVSNGIMFGLLHVPGSNNNLYGVPNQACPATLNSLDPNCAGQNAEYAARDAANNNALRTVFADAKAQNLRAIMIAVQADFYGGNATSCNSLQVTIANVNSKTPTGYRNFMTTFLTEAANYAGRVILFHGDSHVFRLCNPTTLQNVQFLENPGSDMIGWVRATVDPAAVNANNIFSLTHVPISVVGNPPISPPVVPPVSPPVAPVAPAVRSVAPAAAPLAPPVTAPKTAPFPAPTFSPVKKYPECGLLGFSLFCPLKGCGVFGRLFRFCEKT
jgi:hypothetical protein